MKPKTKNTIRVVILEDSDFFNRLLTRQLENYSETISDKQNCEFEIKSYTSKYDFLRHLRENTDIAFLDYYLENGETVHDLLEYISLKCSGCKVVLISEEKSTDVSGENGKAAVEYIKKDVNALPKACFVFNDIVNQKLLLQNQINVKLNLY
jgi:hypothetical protein